MPSALSLVRKVLCMVKCTAAIIFLMVDWMRMNQMTHHVFLTISSFHFPAAVGLCRGPQNKVISLTSETGRIFSPLFPSDFPAGIKCTWVITVPEGHYVKLRMKSLKLDRSCSHSFLYIWDGRNSTSDLLNKFCGEEFEPSVFSSGRSLRVHLDSSRVSESSYHAPGLDAFYETVKQRKRLII